MPIGDSLRMLRSLTFAVAVAPALALAQASPAATAPGQVPIIYPSKGQTPERQDKDKMECYGWAQKQTGYDPLLAAQQRAAAPTDQASGGGRTVLGAARGAVGGVAVGAIAGHPGRGAAIGAAAGGLNGGAAQRQAQMQAQQAAAQRQAVERERLAQYQKAFAACMEGRGYVVK